MSTLIAEIEKKIADLKRENNEWKMYMHDTSTLSFAVQAVHENEDAIQTLSWVKKRCLDGVEMDRASNGGK